MIKFVEIEILDSRKPHIINLDFIVQISLGCDGLHRLVLLDGAESIVYKISKETFDWLRNYLIIKELME